MIGGYLIVEVIFNYLNLEFIDGWIIIWVVGFVLVVDLFIVFLIYKVGVKDSMNICVVFIYNVFDVLVFVVVIIVGILIIFY